MFQYLVVTNSRLQVKIAEDSGRILHRARAFLNLLKDNFPDIVFKRFKGRPLNPEFADLDLILVVPLQPDTNLLRHLIEGYCTSLINNLDPSTVRTSIPRQELRIELSGRGKGGAGTEKILCNNFETLTKKLVAVLRCDAIDPAWVRGTRARATCKHRFGFFISNRAEAAYRGKRGTIHERSGLVGDLGNH